MVNPMFEVSGGKGQFIWTLRAENGEAILHSFHVFTTRRSAFRNIELIKFYMPIAMFRETLEDADIIPIHDSFIGATWIGDNDWQ